ncbi:MAG: DUF5011 domain-containing protein, partial [Chthoniobacterales bacterium]
TGFTSQVWEYSADGITWMPLTTLDSTTITSNFATTGVITLPAITALDNAPDAYHRLTVDGATSSSGNNRLDNIQLVAGEFVPPDTTAPVITVLGDDPLTLPVGTAFTDPGATALDETDGTLEVTAEGVVNTTVPGSYTVTYSASDAAGNTGTATRTVNVIDVTAPLITVAGDNPLYLPVGAAFNDPGVSAFDAIDGDVAVQTSGTVDTSTRGTYVLTYTATDAAGNEATATREVIVRSGAAQFFAAQFGMTNVDLSVDSDGDGAANLMEYAFGTDPTARTDVPTATELQFTADSVRFSTIVRDGDTALTISPVVSTDLVSGWSDAGLTELSVSQSGVPQGFRRRTWESPDTGALFIRFSVSYE